MSQRDGPLSGHNLGRPSRDLWNSLNFKLVNAVRNDCSSPIRTRRTAWWERLYLESRILQLWPPRSRRFLLVEPDDRRQLQSSRRCASRQRQRGERWARHTTNRVAVEALGAILRDAHATRYRRCQGGGRRPDARSWTRSTGSAQARSATDSTGSVTTSTAAEIGARIAYTYLPSTPGRRWRRSRQGFIVSRSATSRCTRTGPWTTRRGRPSGRHAACGAGRHP